MDYQFQGYFDLGKDELEILWSDGVIAIDSNVLIGLYRLPHQSRRDIFKVLTQLGDRLWIPYHVLVEFHRNRLEALKGEFASSKQLGKDVKKAYSRFKSEISTDGNRERACWGQIEEKLKEMDVVADALTEITQTESANYIAPNQPDDVLAFVGNIAKGRSGRRPVNQEEVGEAESEAQARYSVDMGPGFKDQSKVGEYYMFDGLVYERQYGDYMVWKELLRHTREKKIARLLFVTSDVKPDWWLDSKSISGRRPQPELSMEMLRVGGVELFWMYTLTDFIKNAKRRLHAEVADKTIQDARQAESVRPQRLAITRRYGEKDLRDALKLVASDVVECDDEIASGTVVVDGERQARIVVAASSLVQDADAVERRIDGALSLLESFNDFTKLEVVVLSRARRGHILGPSGPQKLVNAMLRSIVAKNMTWTVTLSCFTSPDHDQLHHFSKIVGASVAAIKSIMDSHT